MNINDFVWLLLTQQTNFIFSTVIPLKPSLENDFALADTLGMGKQLFLEVFSDPSHDNNVVVVILGDVSTNTRIIAA